MWTPDESDYIYYDWIGEVLTVLRLVASFVGAIISFAAALVLDRPMTAFCIIVFIACASTVWLELRKAPFRT